jgi:hypothetical protein
MIDFAVQYLLAIPPNNGNGTNVTYD